MKAIIFGISGQDGFYLKNLLLSNQVMVTGVSRSPGDWIRGNIADFHFVERLIREEKPQYIFHLAAISTTKHDALFENHESIATGTINILESCLLHSPDTRIFLSGSALQFENRGLPIDEDSPFTADNVYTLARNYSIFTGRYYRTLGLRVYIGYFFHHDSPKRTDLHLNRRIVDAARSNADGIIKYVHIGDPEVVKEFNFAGDIMEAVWVLINQDVIYEAVIGSGRGYKIMDWLQICFGLAGLEGEKYLKIPVGYKADFTRLVSNPKRMLGLGWTPKVDIHDLAKMMMTS